MPIVSTLPSSSLVRRAAALALFACASTLGLQAQQADTADALPAKVDFTAPAVFDLSQVDGLSYSSSVAPVGDVNPVEAATLEFKGLDLQPPPRRRYGRPRYNDSSHNPDGSNKYTFIAGVGFTLPTGNLHKYNTTNFGFQVGAGRNFNKNFGLLVQFDYDKFGLSGSNVNNQLTIENLIYGGQLASLGGNTHIWSFTLDPVYNFYAREGLGAYVVAGAGFYHKVTSFTTPEEGLEGNGIFEEEVEENGVIDHYTSNAFGVNGGFGFTYKPSRFANEKFYAEARYVFVDNSQRQGFTLANINLATDLSTNFYPANSNRSEYIPIKFGIRF